MKNIYLLTLFTAILFLGSCNSTIYFTQEMRNNLEQNNLEIKDVQFYVSQKLILKRNLTYEETKIARGEITFENGQYVEEIIIPKNTEGIAIDDGSDWLNVAFEQGENRDLQFVMNGENYYQITALEWEGNYGKIKYDTTYYYLEPGGDEALLKVKKEDVFNFQKKRRIVKGRSVGR